MANIFFETGERRAEKVSDLFAGLARRYDRINDLQSFGLHRWWKRRLVRMAAAGPGTRALDLCCGTGDVAFRLAEQGARVTGLDFSQPMLEVAAERSQRRRPGQYPPPEFLRGDALNIPFPDGTFDLVTVSYGLRNLASWERGLDEIWRVLKPGGRVEALDFGQPPNRIWRGIYFSYLRWVVPVFGKLACGCSETFAYILVSLRHYPGQEAVHRRLIELGARDPRIVLLLGGVMSINLGNKPG